MSFRHWISSLVGWPPESPRREAVPMGHHFRGVGTSGPGGGHVETSPVGPRPGERVTVYNAEKRPRLATVLRVESARGPHLEVELHDERGTRMKVAHDPAAAIKGTYGR